MVPDDDPNEAYEVVPTTKTAHGPDGWWTCLQNGIPTWHAAERDQMDRLARDPAARAALRAKSIKLWKK